MESLPTNTKKNEETKLALVELQKLIVQRNRELAERETEVLKMVLSRRSKNALKAKVNEGMSEFHLATAHLEAKIARRCLFHLRERERAMCELVGTAPLVFIAGGKNRNIENLAKVHKGAAKNQNTSKIEGNSTAEENSMIGSEEPLAQSEELQEIINSAS